LRRPSVAGRSSPGAGLRPRPLCFCGKGYRILGRRYCVNGGEIDLIAQKFDAIVFVEVKIRPTAIEARKCRRISRAACLWLAANPWAARLTRRGDAIYLARWRWPRHAIAALPLDIG
jgi:putative endonuclease